MRLRPLSRTVMASAIVLVLATAMYATDSMNLLPNGSFEVGQYAWRLDAQPLDGHGRVIEETDTPHGQRCMQLSRGQDCRSLRLGSDWVTLQPDTPYCFSVYMRGLQPETKVDLTIWSWTEGKRWNVKTETTKTFTVTEQWQHYQVAGKLDAARNGKYQAMIHLRNPGQLLLDAAQLQAGEKASLFQPHHEVECGYASASATNILIGDEPFSIKTTLANHGDLAREVTVNYRLYDVHDKLIEKIPHSQVISGRQRRIWEQALACPRYGHYRLEIETALPDGSVLSNGHLGFCRLSPAPVRPDDRFGLSLAPNNLELQSHRLAQMGIRHVRVHDSWVWKYIEDTKGRFVWPSDRHLEYLAKHGLECMVYGTSSIKPPAWAVDEHDERTCADYTDFGNFYGAFVTHLQGKVANFEVMNEPWSHLPAHLYCKALKAAYRAAKQANPDCTMIALTGYHGPQIGYTRKALHEGALDTLDALSLHPYPRPGPPEPVLGAFIEENRAWMREIAGKEKPLWITEMGWTADGYTPRPTRIPRPASRNNSELEQAYFTARATIIALAYGIERYYAFFFSEDSLFFYPYCMVECDSAHSTRPVLAALATAARQLNGLANAERLIENDDGCYAYHFSDDQQQVIAAWRAYGPGEMTLDAQGQEAVVYDFMGNPVQMIASDASAAVSIAVDVTPIYIHVAGSKPVALTVRPASHSSNNKIDLTNEKSTEPLPKPNHTIWLEAEKPLDINFDPEPDWLPRRLHCYGDGILRIKERRRLDGDAPYQIRYRVQVEQSGRYSLCLAATPFGPKPEGPYAGSVLPAEQLPNLDWNITDGTKTQKAVKAIGEAWRCSTHPSNWWHYRCQWHELGQVTLPAGEHTLTIEMKLQPDSQELHFILDALCLIREP